MNKEELIEMIREEINSLAFETLRNSNKPEPKAFKPKGLTEDELEYALFHGGKKPKDNSLKSITTIREAYDNGLPKIQSVEIIAFEDSFEEMLKEIDGASVVFDTQGNGYSLDLKIGADGIVGGASGIIDMGDKGKVNWSYSIKDGLRVTTQDLKVEQGTKRLLERLYNHYDEWQKEWREKLTIQPGQEVEEPAMESPAPGQESEIDAGIEGGTGVADESPTGP